MDSIIPFTTTPIAPTLGARVTGLDLAANRDNATISTLKAALAEHLVLFLPGQDLSPLELRELTAAFGPLFLHPEVAGLPEAPEVLQLLKEPEDTTVFGGGDWHADVTWRDPAGAYSLLHGKEIPPLGGDTCFASAIAAFAGLSEGLKDFLRGQRALHNYFGPDGAEQEGFCAWQPLVRRQEGSGVEGLYLNAMFATRFEEMTEAESAPLIAYLTEQMIRPEITCRHRWQAGDLVIWDNRFTLHYPVNDPITQRRRMIRATALEA